MSDRHCDRAICTHNIYTSIDIHSIRCHPRQSSGLVAVLCFVGLFITCAQEGEELNRLVITCVKVTLDRGCNHDISPGIYLQFTSNFATGVGLWNVYKYRGWAKIKWHTMQLYFHIGKPGGG